MEHLASVIKQIQIRVWLVSVLMQGATLYGAYYLIQNTHYPTSVKILTGVAGIIFSSAVVSTTAGWLAKLPLKTLGQAIMHIAPNEVGTKAPALEHLKIGWQYVNSLVYQLYQVASLQDNKILAEHRREATQASNILDRMPLPLFVFNKQQLITFATESGLAYCGSDSASLFGKLIYDVMDLEFPSNYTLEDWINECQTGKVTDTRYWRRVRLNPKQETDSLKQCDIAAYYKRDNPEGVEFIVTFFDRTEEYGRDDESLSFVALAVHELRTPLTVLRGYIEVFEEELAGKLDPEMAGFMLRLKASSQQFSSFVNNILNAARIEQNQLEINLSEEKWDEVLKNACADMEIRATTLGKVIAFDIAPNLPNAAVDRTTIYEVFCNLLDNAFKYGGESKQINVKSALTKDGLIETTITDFGVGIPSSVLPNLFEKFHRNHRNRSQITGTGLGLYLSKTIINAHGGDIWVKSKDAEGTTVGFTIKPYSMLADELKNGDNKDGLTRTAHGWIKNHSLYRR